jgi:hypothetical protein
LSQQINLYNPLFLKQEKHFSARTMLQAVGLIALGLAALYVYALVETRAAQRAADQQRIQLDTQQEQMAKLATKIAAQTVSRALEAQIARAEEEVKARRTTLEVLGTGELGNTNGFSDFLAAFGRQALPGVWLTGFTIADSGNELVVLGRALRPELVPAYLRGLNQEPMMRGRRITQMKLSARSAARAPAGVEQKEPERFVEFELTAPLRLAEATPPKGSGQ